MIKLYVFVFVLGLICNTAIAQTTKDVIKFQTYVLDNGTQATPSTTVRFQLNKSTKGKVKITQRIEDVDIKTLSNFIKNLREFVCETVGNGSIKTWVTVGGKVGGVVVSAEANTGMEIIIKCGK